MVFYEISAESQKPFSAMEALFLTLPSDLPPPPISLHGSFTAWHFVI
jgi:hypothetical protein